MKAIVATTASVLAAAGLATMLWAGEAAAKAPPSPSAQDKVTFVYVGFGKNDANFKRASRYYPLELEFMLKGKPKDKPASDVRVLIKDANDKMVVNVTSDGAFLLARLPAGTYRVTAEHHGLSESRTIKIDPRKNQRTVFEWEA